MAHGYDWFQTANTVHHIHSVLLRFVDGAGPGESDILGILSESKASTDCNVVGHPYSCIVPSFHPHAPWHQSARFDLRSLDVPTSSPRVSQKPSTFLAAFNCCVFALYNLMRTDRTKSKDNKTYKGRRRAFTIPVQQIMFVWFSDPGARRFCAHVKTPIGHRIILSRQIQLSVLLPSIMVSVGGVYTLEDNKFHLSIFTFKPQAKGKMTGSGDTGMDAGTPLAGASPLGLGGEARRNEVECLKVVQPRHRCILLLRKTAVRGDVRVIRTSRGLNGSMMRPRGRGKG